MKYKKHKGFSTFWKTLLPDFTYIIIKVTLYICKEIMKIILQIPTVSWQTTLRDLLSRLKPLHFIVHTTINIYNTQKPTNI